MREILVPCSGCDVPLKLTESHVGQRVRCPKCGSITVVPEQTPTPEPPVFEAELAEEPSSRPEPPHSQRSDRDSTPAPRDTTTTPRQRPAWEDEGRPRARGWGDENPERRGESAWARRGRYDDPSGRDPSAPKKKRFFGPISLLTALMLLGYGISLALVMGDAVTVPVLGLDRNPPPRDLGRGDWNPATGKRDIFRPDAIDLVRDAAAEERRTAARNTRLADLRAAEQKLIESLGKGQGKESTDLALMFLDSGDTWWMGLYPTFSPDGMCLAAILNNRVRVWDLRTGKIVRTLTGPVKIPDALAFSADGSQIIAVVGDEKRAWFWDAQSGKLDRTLDLPLLLKSRMTFSPDAKYLAADTEDSNSDLKVWSLTDGSIVQSFRNFEGGNPDAAFRPDGKVIATASASPEGTGRIELWELETGRPYRRSFERAGNFVTFAPDGWTLASAHSVRENVVRLYDLETGAERELAHTQNPNWATFSPDGKLFLTSDGMHMRLWDAKEGKELARHDVHANRPTFSPGGSMVVEQGGKLWLVSELLDTKLASNLAKARSLAHITRNGAGFNVRFDPTAKLDDLVGLTKLLPLTSLTLIGVEGVNDAWLAELKSLTDLRHLYLRNCRGITNAGLAHLAGMKQLQTLDLGSASRITDAGLAHCEGMTELTRVWLAGTRVTDAGLARLAKATRVRFLDLSGLPITDDGLKALAGMTEMDDLSIGNAGITDAGLVHLAGMTQLTRLDLNGNDEVKKDGFAHLKGMTRLLDLDLAETGIEDTGLAHLAGLTNLTRLDLTDTRVTDKGLVAVKGMTKLVALSLPPNVTDAGLVHLAALVELASLDWGDGKGITGPGLAHLAGMKKIESWDLSPTGVTNEGLAHLEGWTHIKHLTLPGRIDDSGLAHLRSLIGLDSLNLTGCQITNAGLAHVQKLAFLQSLILSNTPITDAGLPSLRRLIKLTYLNLDGTKIGDAGLAEVAKMTKLRTISLQRTQVSDTGLGHLHHITKLGALYLKDSKVTDKGVAEIKKAIPEVSVTK